ncbi:hypothetical protein V1478_001656 [Vespula squamosa]|uniref:Uncharacterized protein n=1 Tax=Vespula squamosa TaxID=30214 RepID=A0ABD2C2L1_VESSQ
MSSEVMVERKSGRNVSTSLVIPKLQERKHRAIARENICTTREMFKPFQFSYVANSVNNINQLNWRRFRTRLEDTDHAAAKVTGYA